MRTRDDRRGLAIGAVGTKFFETLPKIPALLFRASREERWRADRAIRRTAALDARRSTTYVRPPTNVVAKRRAAGKRQRQARAMHRRVARR